MHVISYSWLSGLLSLLTLFSLAGCSLGGGDSQMRIPLPPHPNVSAKSVNQMTSPALRGFCYAVNVVGSDLSPKTKQCYPALGVSSGFQDPLSTIQLSVKQGAARRIELFGYLPKPGEACASVLNLHSVDLARLFLMGAIDGVDMRQAETNVSMIAQFPGLNTNYVRSANLPESCLTASLPLGGAPAQPVGGRLTGTKYAVTGGIGSGTDTRLQTGTKYKVQRELRNVTH